MKEVGNFSEVERKGQATLILNEKKQRSKNVDLERF